MTRPRFLILASEWFSRRGGLSSLNRSMCRALASAGYETVCLTPHASSDEIEDARTSAVSLVAPPAAHTIGLGDEAALCLRAELGTIDVVVGHGHVTGSAAAARVVAFHPAARRVHVFHTSPDELEWLKGDPEAALRAEGRQRVQAQLAATASFSLSVGPRLARQWTTHLSGENASTRTYRLDPGPDHASRVSPGPPPTLECLVLGRAEDVNIKGIDIAARALGALRTHDSFFEGSHEPVLVVRGARVGSELALRDALREAAGTGLIVNVKPYTDGIEEIRKDILRASVVLMPSRAEGFGLVALEAIEHGVPVLVSSRSGFAELLYERADADGEDKFALEFIVDVKDDERRDMSAWSSALARILKDRKAAFEKAGRLRDRLLAARYWEQSVAQIIGQLEFEAIPSPSFAPTSPPSPPPGLNIETTTEWWAERNPAASIERTTESLNDGLARFAAKRGAAVNVGAANQTAMLGQLVARGLLSDDAVRSIEALFHRRNVAVHSREPGLGKGDAILHATRVEQALERLRTHADKGPITEIFGELKVEAGTLVRRLQPELHRLAGLMPRSERDRAVVVIADTEEATARALALGVLNRLGRRTELHDRLFYAAQPVDAVLELLAAAGMQPLPPSLVEPTPPDRVGAIRILILMRGGYHVQWWTPPPEMSSDHT